MKAAVYDRYGDADVIGIREVARPEPKPSEVLVKVFATTVTSADWRLRASAFPGGLWLAGRLFQGLRAPRARNRILGAEFAGRVVSLGGGVTRFRLGDAVMGFSGNGAHAEHLAIAETAAIVPKPPGLGYAEAAAVPFGALTALVFLRDVARVRPGQRVLILGASGGVGVPAVQIAKHFGAHVTGVCSTANVDLVASLGADRVIDYTREDYARMGERYDLVLDTVGASSFARCKGVLAAQGLYVPLEFGLRGLAQALTTRLRRGPRVVVGVSGSSQEDLAIIAGLIEQGALHPVIDSTFPLERIAEAHRRVESRRKTGSVVVAVDLPGQDSRAAA